MGIFGTTGRPCLGLEPACGFTTSLPSLSTCGDETIFVVKCDPVVVLEVEYAQDVLDNNMEQDHEPPSNLLRRTTRDAIQETIRWVRYVRRNG